MARVEGMAIAKKHYHHTLSEAIRVYKELQRKLPWRVVHDPYCIAVSEYMLQQTQVGRVVPKYKEFLQKFPNVEALACSTRREVLLLWSGLGYNRRGIALHNAAKMVVETFGGRFPETEEELLLLPGVGRYTAAAIRAFAYNEDTIMLETNIRTVILHHFFQRQQEVSDKEIETVLHKLFLCGKHEGYDPRTFYSALMDYGAYLKRSGVRINTKSKHYKQQSTFNGSLRQARGELLRLLLQTPKGLSLHAMKQRANAKKIDEAIASLIAEGVVKQQASRYILA